MKVERWIWATAGAARAALAGESIQALGA
jgi:hypothetical protein